MKTVIVAPTCTADSAKDLGERLGVEVSVRGKDDPFQINFGIGIQLINWGCSRLEGDVVINKPRAVRRSLNKLRTFELLSDKVRMPVMTRDMEEAKSWAAQGRTVVVRSLIKGCKSKGITLTKSPDEIAQLEDAKFYTRFIANCTEYRVNVYKGEVLTVYRKDPCAGDFRFKIQLDKEAEYQSQLKEFISNVHEHIGLDVFGLDMLHTPKGKWFLLEVNSAPILFPITYKRLARKLKAEVLQNV